MTTVQASDVVTKFNEVSKERDLRMQLKENQSLNMSDFQKFLFAFQEQLMEPPAIKQMLGTYWANTQPNGASGALLTFYQVSFQYHVMPFCRYIGVWKYL